MDYKKHYLGLLEKATNRILTGYHEIHHIVPRCVGGDDSPENLIKLTPEEHYLAHLLLCKIYPGNPSLVSAAMMMCANRSGNKVYGWLRRNHAIAMSLHQKGEKNSQFGTIWINKSGITQKVKKSEVTEYLNNGWSLGRKEKVPKVKEKKPKGIYTDKYKWILDEESIILKEFDNHGSVTKILHERGFKNREGNVILSKWLKSKGRKILRRRNTAGVA